MAKAKKLKSGHWRVQVFSHYDYVGGQKKPRYRSFTASTRVEAEMMAASFAADKERFANGSLSIGEAVDKYIADKEPVLSPSTVRSYLGIRKRLDIIEHIKVDALTSADLQHWVSILSAQIAPKSVKNAYALVTAAVSIYVDKIFRVTLPARKPLQYDVPTDAGVEALMAEARHDLKIAIALAAIGTLRRGEICALKYKDIMRDFKAIYVHSDMVLNKDNVWIHKEMPKTADSVRRVTLPDEVIELLGDGEPEEYILKCSPAAVSDAFGRLRNKVGLKCRFHDLRHYAASILHAIGVPDQYIMERGGWSTDGTLKAVYRNTLSDKSLEYQGKANDYFSSKLFKKEG